MTWIRFDPEELAAPLTRLFELPGASPKLAHLHGRANLVIFFAHSLECRACRAAIDEFVRLADEFKARDAEVIVVLQQGAVSHSDVSHSDMAQAANFRPLHMLIDRDGAARDQLGRLLEFDTRGQLLLVILNVFAAPSAAWVGDDPGPQDDLHRYALQRLDFISIQCPE
jgi:peroxiredoxin